MNKTLLYFAMLFVFMTNAIAVEEVLVGVASFDGRESVLLDSQESKLAMLVPATMVIVAILFFAIDFGTIGITIAMLLGLIIVNLIGLVAISAYSIVSGIIMGGILLYKLANI